MMSSLYLTIKTVHWPHNLRLNLHYRPKTDAFDRWRNKRRWTQLALNLLESVKSIPYYHNRFAAKSSDLYKSNNEILIVVIISNWCHWNGEVIRCRNKVISTIFNPQKVIMTSIRWQMAYAVWLENFSLSLKNCIVF